MARKVFFSFNFKKDSQRVAKVKNMGVVEGQKIVSSNEWEDVKKGGEPAIKKWIETQMSGKSCAVVLIGSQTAGRKWVKYEIKKAWDEGRGVLGIYIHNLTDLAGNSSTKGANPFSDFVVGTSKRRLSSVVKSYDPPYQASANVYNHIKENLPSWVEEAVKIRKDFSD